MKKFIVFICLLSCEIYASEPLLSENSYGPIQFGSQYSDVADVLGKSLTKTFPENTECVQLKFENFPLAYFMVENGAITRADLGKEGKNSLGIKSGEATKDVLKKHSSIIVTPHKYDSNGHYLIFKSKNGKNAIVIEESNGIITDIRAGLEPSVEYVEGCL